MKKIKTQEEWLKENTLKENEFDFDALHEDAEIEMDVMLDDKPEEVEKALDDMGVKDKKVLPFGVIKVKAKKKEVQAIKSIEGVEDVEIIK
jgi:hypothetical protein